MSWTNRALLLALAAIWGSSFIFMRALAPVLGPVATATSRTLVAGLFLVAAFALFRARMDWKRNSVHYLTVGLVNSALPFALYSFAALRLPASVPAIVNALTPVWGAAFAFLWEFLFFGAAVSPAALGGSALVLSGTALVAGTGKKRRDKA